MYPKTRLLTPGPTPLPEQVRLALAQDMIHHRKSEFKALMHRVQAGLKALFGSTEPVLPLSCSGTGAMEAALANLFRPKDRVLVIEGGKFGQRWADIASSLDLVVEKIQVAWGQAVDPGQVQARLGQQRDFKAVLVQASETSTGVLHPVQEIAAVVKPEPALLVVDGISAVGVSPCPMHSWGIDCLLTGSQKGLMLPPGMALISLSRPAWDLIEDQPKPPFYFNLSQERQRNAQDQTLYTSPVSHILGLEAALDLLLKPGLETLYKSQWSLTQMTRAGLEAMGLSLFAKRDYTWGLTSIELPREIDGQQVLDLAATEYGVFLAGGQGRLKGRILRLGHMGFVDWGDILSGLSAIGRSCQRLGMTVDLQGGLATAMAAYENAINTFRLEDHV